MRSVERRVTSRAVHGSPSDADRLDLPHVVHVFDRLLAEHSVIGPFDDPVAACCYAERFRDEVLPAGADPELLEIAVVPLDAAPAVRPRQEARRR